MESAVLFFGVKNTHQSWVGQVHHCPSAAKEALGAKWVAGEIRVQHLDRNALLRRAVIRLPDHREAAATDDLHEEISTVAQGVPGAEPPSFAQLPAQLEDLSVEVVRRDFCTTQIRVELERLRR